MKDEEYIFSGKHVEKHTWLSHEGFHVNSSDKNFSRHFWRVLAYIFWLYVMLFDKFICFILYICEKYKEYTSRKQLFRDLKKELDL